MLQPFVPFPGQTNALYSVCEPNEIWMNVLNGWKPIGVITQSSKQQVGRTHNIFHPESYGQNGQYHSANNHNFTLYDEVYVEKTLIVLEKDSSSALPELDKQIKTMAEACRKTEEEKKATGEELKKTNMILEDIKYKLERSQSNHTEMSQSMDGLKSKNRKMEQDLAAVRVAIGDLRFNEIVGAKKDGD